MSFLTITNKYPVVGPVSEDGRQKISVRQKSGARRVYVSTPDKIDEFIQSHQRTNSMYKFAGALAVIAGPVLGILSDIKFNQARGGHFAAGIALGLLTHFGIRSFCSNKLADKENQLFNKVG